ncbi:MAG TPA: DUF4214 domain-containing protein, partial [Pirellulales bacterium]|nr:DUF4214 domain-containing protein [Pirellulales bacterium]
GDGNSSTGTVSLSSGTLTVTGSHLYSTTGTEAVTVVLTDDTPGTATATASATITVAPAATITPVGTVTISATEGTTFSSTALATFTDTDATAVASDFTATINWGDGSTLDTVSGASITGLGGTFTVAGSHLYSDELTAGSVSVVLTETTPSSGTGTATGTATAAEADVLTAGTPVTATAAEGTTFTGTVATFTNTGYPTNPASDFTATINWGDGTSSTGTVSLASGTLTVRGNHLYSTTGTETATIVLTDDTPGTASATATATVTVAAAATLTPVGTVTVSATEGTTFSSTTLATFTDSDTTAVASDFTATINWGDGTSSTGSVTGSGGTLTVSGSHLYSDELSAGSASVVLTQTTGTATGTSTGTANVSEADTLAAGTPVTTTATAGSTFSGTVATFTNTGHPTNPASDFTATINWGDGTSGTGTVSLTNGTLTVTGSHVYGAAGTDTVTVVLTDDSPGTASATATATITVSPSTTPPTTTGNLAGQAGDGTNLTFVTNLYRELLGREPDAAGQAYWLGILGGNGASSAVRAEVARGFLYSAEFDIHFVTLLYVDFLGRAPDAPGLQFFSGRLAQKHDLVEIIKFIAGSQEYYVRAGGTDQGFVTALYRDLFGRATDPTFAFWVNEIGAEGRDNVVSGMLLTSEGGNKFFNGNFEALLANPPVASAGTVQTGNYALANLTGNGYADLFFQGNPDPTLVSTAVSQLLHNGGKNAIEALVGLLSSSQYYG